MGGLVACQDESHLPPFRGFGFAEVNMAEAGNNIIQESTPCMLVDCAMNLNQDADYQAFLDNEGQSTSRGPNLVSRADDDRRGQMSRAKQFAKLFRNRNMDNELEQFNNPSQLILVEKLYINHQTNGMVYKVNMYKKKQKKKKNKQNKTKREITLDNLKEKVGTGMLHCTRR